jgi:Family of unknown function (DUF6622)
MIIGILQNTPLWVWAVLLGLVVLGSLQARTRRVNRILVLLLPATMIPLSLYAVMASFGVSIAAFGAWAAGVAIAVAVNSLVFMSPKGVRYSLEDQKFELPGSWVPLALLLTIFCTRFVVGASTGLNSPIVGTVGFVGCVSMVLGSCSGLFLSRAMRILSVQHHVHA